MAANEMTFNQAATFLNAVQRQVTGVDQPAPLNTNEFAAVATTVLKTGFDPVMNAISQVLARTIFSIRPYSAKFRLAEISETAFGNHTRKLSIADKELVDDERYKYPMAYDSTQTPPNGDGNSVDMYKVRKPEILQTNFYGSQVWEDYYTLFRDQLECAFTSPSEMGRFVTMVTQNSMDKLTQYREDAGRAAVLNFIGGILAEGDTATNGFSYAHRVIPLITLYKDYTNQESLSANDIFNPQNMRPFTQFVYSTIMTVSNLMEQRSVKFQTQITGKNVVRHTPKSRQKMFMLEQFKSMFDMMGLANTYHDGYLVLPGGVRTESVAYWQNIGSPLEVNVYASRITPTGAVDQKQEAKDGVIACLFDEEALGYATTQSWQAPTPFNAAGGYWNMFVHETEKVYNDHTEKGVVFTVD